MQLIKVRLVEMGPFDDVVFPFADEDGSPRGLTLVQGAGGVGKTTLLSAIANTRPGYAVVQHPASTGELDLSDQRGTEPKPPFVVCDWITGQDDPQRPHALHVATPNARVFADDEQEVLRRREQALYERTSRAGGFAFLAIPSSRWFARQPIALHAPARSVARYDVRTPAVFEDAARSELGRDTKQALAYAAISAAVNRELAGGTKLPFERFASAMHEAVDTLVQLAGYRYQGIDPGSLEPLFRTSSGRSLPFDALPTHARHLICFAALPVRLLWAAYPGRDPKQSEGVVAIDEVDLHLDGSLLERLIPALRDALPAVQWILTTTSAALASTCHAREVLALRRLPQRDHVQLFVGEHARTH